LHRKSAYTEWRGDRSPSFALSAIEGIDAYFVLEAVGSSREDPPTTFMTRLPQSDASPPTMQPDLRSCPQCCKVCPTEHQYCPSCGFPIANLTGPRDDPFIGQTLPGGYHILDLISVGGMGRVYRAEQSVLGRTVAVKIIHPHLLADENAALRFLTEARASSQLNHPNSIAVYEFGRTMQGQPYLVMEFLRGRDLARVTAEEGLLQIPRIVNVLIQVLSALSEAHELGIVHRDLKPENVVLEPLRRGGDLVKVLDFGLAKLKADNRAPRNVTSPGIVCGTPDYMAPEQGQGDPIDGRSDLYAVGVMLFQLLTGRLPFDAESPTQIVMMHLTVPPPDPREVAPHRNISDALAAVVAKALEKKASRRYQDAIEFADALRDALAHSDVSLPPSRRSMVPLSSSHPATTIPCPACGLVVPAGRFCLDCGHRLPTHTDPPIRASQVKLPLVLLERDDEWEWLSVHASRVEQGTQAARLVGDLGAGKSRLLHDFLRHAEASGALVVITGPDPYWAEVPCHALRDMVEQLVVVDDAVLDGSDSGVDENVRMGLREILGHDDSATQSIPEEDRRRARLSALRWAFEKAQRDFSPSSILLGIDDLQRLDSASRISVADVVDEVIDLPLFVIATHPPNFDPKWSARHPMRLLSGLRSETAGRLLRSARAEIPPGFLDNPTVPPLMLDQLLRYGQEGGSDPSPRLVDLVAQRLDVLPPEPRRALQAIAILGDRVAAPLVSEIVPKSDDVADALQHLEQRGMIWSSSQRLSIDHPLLREVVLAAIPAAVRRELHGKALAIATRQGYPLEARAQLSFYAEDTFQAMLLLERVAENAAQRGDTDTEILALRRGLELGRLEISRGELDDPMRAVVIFSRKLGGALTRAGNLTDAEGILREALDYAPPTGGERAQLLAALGQVARERGRANEAMQYLQQAMEAARQTGSAELMAILNNTCESWLASRSVRPSPQPPR
jgi:serine/threonine protein kinase